MLVVWFSDMVFSVVNYYFLFSGLYLFLVHYIYIALSHMHSYSQSVIQLVSQLLSHVYAMSNVHNNYSF